ncbi:TadE/TadG family type IV pilus assembly protein [Roseivivax sp. CAU 1753]
MMTNIKSLLARFRHDTEGTVTVEAVIIFPALVWLFGATWVWFDVSRQQAINQKANYTIGDAISRETDPLTDAYVDAAFELVLGMTRSNASESDMRITAVEYSSKGEGSYDVLWSEARGNYPAFDNNDMDGMETRLPIMSNGDQVILVETWEDYVPALEAGLDAFEIKTYSFTRPRFAPQMLYEGKSFHANNGWGNGDQDAPGGSLCNNNAENADEGAAAEQCADNVDGTENQGNGKSKKK